MNHIISHRIMLCRLAWINIVFQVAFPLAVAFTPAVVGAESNKRFLNTSADKTLIQTRTHTLSVGETVASVAKQYNITPDELRKLNQFRTFAHGFDNLQPGDELDVPITPLPEVKWDEGAAVSAQNNEQAHKVASLTSQAGSFLTNSPDGYAMARGMATSTVSSEMQQWLNRFGTARIELNVDENFSLKNSQFDLLLPLYDRDENMAFTQGSLHRTDGRTQSNLGFGLRHFTSSYMLGGNIFGDYDLSRDHARLGLGVEYWRDYLKLSANNYLRLTNWKVSPDLEDYEERPANGWDIRAQAWLPSLPQLGGKLTYEQYYGDEVALFGRDNRQKNPHAITAGVSYTPVPLLTFSAEQRQGKSSENDTRFGVELNYQLGVPWQQQVDPDAVAAMRSLAGSRYDLVERNNNIVLEYRKKEVIQLNTADLVSGYAGEQKSLGVSVTSKYGLERINWSASSLVAAGGKIVQSGSDWVVILPAYRQSPQGVNSYIVSGVAVDKKGNISSQSETRVTVLESVVSSESSTFTPANSTLAADSKSTQVLTLMVRDERNQVIDIPVGDIAINTSTLKSATVSMPIRKSAGIYEVTVTAGKDIETVTVTPRVRGVAIHPAVVTITESKPTQGSSLIGTDSSTYAAGSDMVVTVTLKDAQGNPVTGQSSALASAVTVPNATAAGGWTDRGDGTYQATYRAVTAGTGLTATLQLSGWSGAVSSSAYAITGGSAAQTGSLISTDSSTYTAGSDMVVTVTLKDAQGNPLTGQSSVLASAVTVPNATAAGGWTDRGDGTYQATYRAVTAGTGLTATLQLSGWSGAVSSSAFTITGGPPAQADSLISTDSSTYTAGDDMVLTVTLKDAQGNPITGQSSALTSAVTVPNATAAGSWTDRGDGTYQATYRAVTAGTGLTATLQISGWSGAVSSSAYAITEGTPAQASSLISTDKNSYTVGTDMVVTVTLKDAQGNPVTGQSSALTSAVTVPNATAESGWTDRGDGTYQATYRAVTVSTGLMATLQLSGWSSEVSSSAYAITGFFVGTTNVSGTQNVGFYPRTFSVSFTPSTGGGFDETCFTVQGTAGIGNALTTISSWGETSMNQNYAGTYSYALTVSNSCGTTISGTVNIRFYRSDASGSTITRDITVISYPL